MRSGTERPQIRLPGRTKAGVRRWPFRPTPQAPDRGSTITWKMSRSRARRWLGVNVRKERPRCRRSRDRAARAAKPRATGPRRGDSDASRFPSSGRGQRAFRSGRTRRARKPVGRKLARCEAAREVQRRHDTRSSSRLSRAFVKATMALSASSSVFAFGHPGYEQGLVVVGEPRDAGDGAMQGEEVAMPADWERALGAALANADDAGAVCKCDVSHGSQERGGVTAREC